MAELPPALLLPSRRFQFVVTRTFQPPRDHRARHEYQQEDRHGGLEGQDDWAQRSTLLEFTGRFQLLGCQRDRLDL